MKSKNSRLSKSVRMIYKSLKRLFKRQNSICGQVDFGVLLAEDCDLLDQWNSSCRVPRPWDHSRVIGDWVEDGLMTGLPVANESFDAFTFVGSSSVAASGCWVAWLYSTLVTVGAVSSFGDSLVARETFTLVATILKFEGYCSYGEVVTVLEHSAFGPQASGFLHSFTSRHSEDGSPSNPSLQRHSKDPSLLIHLVPLLGSPQILGVSRHSSTSEKFLELRLGTYSNPSSPTHCPSSNRYPPWQEHSKLPMVLEQIE